MIVKRSTTFSCLALAVTAVGISPAARPQDNVPQNVSFIRAVAPILVSKCMACHGNKVAESNYRLDTFALMMQSGDFGTPPITPRELENSELYRLITTDDPEARMPNNGSRLADSEIKLIANWILQGAEFDGENAEAPLREQIPRDIPHPPAPETYPAMIPVTAMTFSPDGSQLLVGGYHELLIRDAASGALVERVGNIGQRTFGMAISPDHRWLAVAGGAPGVLGEVRLIAWPIGSKRGERAKVLATADDVFFDVAFRPQGRELAASAADGSVRVFDLDRGVERLRIESHANWVTDICYSPDGRHIATASRDRSAKIFDAESGTLIATHSEHGVPVRAVAFSPDGQHLFSVGARQIHIWTVGDSKTIGQLTDFQDDVYVLLVSGENLMAASADRTVRRFKLSDRSASGTLADHSARVLSLAWHEPTKRLAVGSFDGMLTVWNLENETKLWQLPAFPHKAERGNER